MVFANDAFVQCKLLVRETIGQCQDESSALTIIRWSWRRSEILSLMLIEALRLTVIEEPIKLSNQRKGETLSPLCRALEFRSIRLNRVDDI